MNSRTHLCRALALSLITLITLWPTPTRAQVPDGKAGGGRDVTPIEFQTETLPNGLRVAYVPLRQAPVVHVRVLYHVGSKDERPDRQGFAHMFEHMMFRGSAHVQPEEHMRRINGVGGISNAFTSFDQTTYVNTVPAGATEMALWLEADRMASFKVTDQIYQIERRVVAQEWAMRMNQPYGNLYEEFLKQAYAKHSYRWTPIGNMEHLKAAATSELQDFFNTYYVPNNAILVVAGDIDVAKTREWVKKYYAWIPKGGDPTRLAPREPEQTEGKRAVVPANVPLPAVLVGVRIAPFASDDQYAIAVLDEVMGSGRSSRLNKRLVSGEHPLCTEAQTMRVPLEDGGIFGAFGMLLAGKNADDVEKALREELLAVAEKGVTDEELAKAKTQVRLGIIRGRKTAEDLAKGLGEEWLFANDPKRVNEELAKVDKLTRESVAAVAKQYIQPAKLTVLQMVPDPTGQLAKKAMAEARATATANVTASPEPAKPRVVDFPADYPTKAPQPDLSQEAKFQKGQESKVGPINVVTMTENRLPLAGFSLAIRRGGYTEPADKTGLAGLTAEMLRRGSGGIPYDTLNETLDAKGISIGVSDGGDHTRLNVTCPSDQLDEAVRLATLILHKPDFPQDQFDRLKAQAISSLTAELASPTTVADREISRLLYGDTPLGRSATPQSLASITLEDVKSFYAKTYVPADAILLAAGDVTTERGAAVAKQWTEGWNTGTGDAAAMAFNLPPAPEKRTVLLVDNPDARQADIRLGVRAYTVASDDKYAGALANQILSGGIESRIMRYVRAEKGLAYHAHAVFMPGRLAGAFLGQTGTQPDKAADAISAMFEVLDKTRQAGVTPEELADAKQRVAGRMIMQMQTIEQQAERRLEGILNGYPADYYDRYAKRVSEVPAEQLQQLLQKYADPGKIQIVVVAPAADTKEKLSKLGEVKVQPMPTKPNGPPELLNK